MARFVVSKTSGVEVGVEYDANNGKVTSLYCDNTSGVDVYATAVLADGRVAGQLFPQGNLFAAIPANAATISFAADGEVTLAGLARVVVRSIG